jgi:competence protein ComEA
MNHFRRICTLGLAVGLAITAPRALALDVNTASAEQLTTIRGVGPKTAEAIVRERERGGRFESLEDLSERVRGIGARKAQAMQAAGLAVEAKSVAPADSKAAPAGVRPRPGGALPVAPARTQAR